jgi:hypothetical protein
MASRILKLAVMAALVATVAGSAPADTNATSLDLNIAVDGVVVPFARCFISSLRTFASQVLKSEVLLTLAPSPRHTARPRATPRGRHRRRRGRTPSRQSSEQCSTRPAPRPRSTWPCQRPGGRHRRRPRLRCHGLSPPGGEEHDEEEGSRSAHPEHPVVSVTNPLLRLGRRVNPVQPERSVARGARAARGAKHARGRHRAVEPPLRRQVAPRPHHEVTKHDQGGDPPEERRPGRHHLRVGRRIRVGRRRQGSSCREHTKQTSRAFKRTRRCPRERERAQQGP